MSAPLRLAVFGVTGQLGQELVDRLDETEWPIGELLGIASGDSLGATFTFRGEQVDVVGEWPSLKGCDLVFICTREALEAGPGAGPVRALEIVRECLRAEVPCIDLTGALAGQAEVPLPVALDDVAGGGSETAEPLAAAPLVALPSSTTLAWAPVLRAIAGLAPIRRVVATVLSSAGAHGRRGVVSLSEESIALFNQSQQPSPGPAGQAVAFDVLPGGGIDRDRVRGELARVFGESLRIDLASVQIPTFVGEGASLALELASPVAREAIETALEEAVGLSRVAEGLGARGLAVVDEEAPEPLGPTLRDAVGVEGVLVGRLDADESLEEGLGWRLWLASDPLRLAADHAVAIAARRLGRV